ncbi:MAG TPA: FAD-dependent oxidoreductase [Dehalococcoidales bacterium]|nr:FAD-dependent oxidoreductase [Dehalococcoidales bacterium]
MALKKEIYQEFEDIVGIKNISDDPALLDSYRYPLVHTAIHLGPYYGVFTPRGEAVLLPGSTEEVQAIVKLCNKYKIKFKASSTFWSAMGYPSHDGAIQLDMRRMDKIIEIDEKNMYAVIEPYVIGTVLQAEAMKVGLNTHIIGAGSSCSPLASASSFAGAGPAGSYMGGHGENMLGVEWVMPNGELVRTGTLGSRCGWFCGEGPGPSIRSLIRGALGGQGGMGVFTKLALKLFPWPGPQYLPVTGKPPAYKAALPDNFRSYTLAFPTWQAYSDASHKIWDAEIGYIAHRQFNFLGRDLKWAMVKILTDPNATLSDLQNLMKDKKVLKDNETMKRDFQLILAGMTPRDIAWQEKALDQILAEVGGWKVECMLDPDIKDWSMVYMIRLGHKNLNLVYGGGYDGAFGLPGEPDFGIQHIEEASDFKREWEKKGDIVAAGGDCTMGGIGVMGGGGITIWENFAHFDPYDEKSTRGCLAFFDATAKLGIEKGWGPPMEKQNDTARWTDGYATPKEIRNKLLNGSAQPSAFWYQRKVKELFDPNDLGDYYYRALEK